MAQEGLPTRTDVWITEASQEFPPIVGEDSPPEWKPLTVMESFDEAIEIRGDKGALYTKNKEGKWDELTWRQYHQQIMQAGRAFVKLGLPRHAGVAILGFNSVEWFVAKFGGIFAGGIDAGVYQTNGPEAIQHLVTLCDAHICFADSPSALARFYALRDSMPTVKVMVMWGDEEVPASIKSDDNLKIMHWTEFMELGADDVESQRALDEVIATQKPGHVCSLIFTSGTTGPAKGVMLTHDNIMWTAKSSGDFNGSNETSIAISFLPLAHIAAQIIDQLAHLRTGFKVYFAQPDALRGSLADTLREVRPTHFICVPRVWEKMMETIKAQSAKTKGMKKSIGGWARGVGTQAHKNFNEDKGNPWGYFMANQLVFKKVRAALGLDRCVWNVAAAAPISPDVWGFSTMISK